MDIRNSWALFYGKLADRLGVGSGEYLVIRAHAAGLPDGALLDALLSDIGVTAEQHSREFHQLLVEELGPGGSLHVAPRVVLLQFGIPPEDKAGRKAADRARINPACAACDAITGTLRGTVASYAVSQDRRAWVKVCQGCVDKALGNDTALAFAAALFRRLHAQGRA